MTQAALADRHYLEWYAYDNLTDNPDIVMDSRFIDYSGYLLMSLTGASDMMSDPRFIRSPGQVGDTLIDIDVPSKVMSLTVAVAADSPHGRSEYWVRKDLFIRAMYQPKPRGTALPTMGRLVLYRPGQPVIELPCVPRSSPKEGARPDSASMIMTVEFYAPHPYWRYLDDVTTPFEVVGGMEFPVEMPYEMPSLNNDAILDNIGHVEVSAVARIYGEITNPKLELIETGESFTITGTIAEDDYLEISTEYGRKYVTYHHADGTTDNWLTNFDLDVSSFWQLIRGPQTIRLTASSNVSGHAEVVWRPKVGGA